MQLQFEFLMKVAADVGELTSMGGGPLGERRVVAITGDRELQWLNRCIAVATAQRKARQVLLEVYKLL